MSVDPNIQNDVLSFLSELDANDQAKVVDFARTLAESRPRGTPGQAFERLIGAIPHDDLMLMKKVIEQECERVDANEW